MIHFLGNNEKLIEEYNKDEILDVEWIDINNYKSLEKNQFRKYDVFRTIMDSLSDNNLYEMDIIKFYES